MRDTTLKRYGFPCSLQAPAVKTKTLVTNLEKYGTEIPMRNEEIHRKVVEKSRDTMMERYGVRCASHIGRSKEYLLNVSDKEHFRQFLISNSIFRVSELSESLDISQSVACDYLRKYDSWDLIDKTGSEPEDNFYEYLCSKYGSEDIIRQYKEERYPFKCDFYIRSIDTFVELNLHWTHGPCEFDSTNEEHIKRLSELNRNAEYSSYYMAAIQTWTISDPLKVRFARQNNLNYVMYYGNDNLYDGRI